jgi:GNAT superfamily N-acetyltransferase
VDLDTGKIVGMALWDVYLTPSTWKRPEIGWLSGEERECAESIISPLWDAREEFWLNQRYLYCHVVAVHPEYQRQGVGQLLMNFGICIAQKARLPIYIESSQDGVRLYEKLGCRRLKQPSNGKNRKTLPAEDGPKRGGEGVLFVWVPQGGESCLPTNVRKAQI